MDIKELYSIFVKCGSVATDSRAISGGELFFALKGENFDGNEYAVKALEAGAAYAVVNADAPVAGKADCYPSETEAAASSRSTTHWHSCRHLPAIIVKMFSAKATI